MNSEAPQWNQQQQQQCEDRSIASESSTQTIFSKKRGRANSFGTASTELTNDENMIGEVYFVSKGYNGCYSATNELTLRTEKHSSRSISRIASAPSLAIMDEQVEMADNAIALLKEQMPSKKIRFDNGIFTVTTDSKKETIGRVQSMPTLFQPNEEPSVPTSQPHTHNPEQLVKEIFHSNGCDSTVHSALELNDFFLDPTEEQIASYDTELTLAVRSGNVAALREMHAQGRPMQCCNRFGESILHMACRKGLLDVVIFLLEEGDVSMRVRDDFGRTPLHDACWTRNPEFELVRLLAEREPTMLLMKDKRGSTPMGYVRRDHWDQWCQFLEENRSLLDVCGEVEAI